MSIYDFTIKKADGTEVPMTDYSGKVLLIVNTATGCGFTPQYTDLQTLYDKVKDQGFEILTSPATNSESRLPAVMRRSTPSARGALASPSRSLPR